MVVNIIEILLINEFIYRKSLSFLRDCNYRQNYFRTILKEQSDEPTDQQIDAETYDRTGIK